MLESIEVRLKELMEFYPATEKQQNVKKLLDFVAGQLEQLGFRVTPFEYDGFYSLYAHPQGKKKSQLLLQAHIDVVPAKSQPFRADNEKIYGRGSYDMLFGAACYLELLHELKDKIEHADIGIMLCGDEEYGGFNGVMPFLEEDYAADLCILPDAGEGFGSLNIAAKGIYTMRVRVHGKAHHGSRPWEGDGAAGKMVQFLSKLHPVFDAADRHNSTMTIARLSAGDSENKGPATADCTLDIRYKDKADLTRIQQELNRLLVEFDVEVLEVKDGDNYQLDLENSYVKSFLALYEKHAGKSIELTKAHGSSDARFFAARDIPVIMLRPDGGGAHGDDEWISKPSLEKFYKLLKEYILTTAKME